MRVHYIKIEKPLKPEQESRASIGGKPVLAAGQKWPQCRLCKEHMIHFFQFDLNKEFDLPLKSKSHLLVFMCPVHNDIPLQLLEEEDVRLPENYWQKDYGHYSLLLNRPGDETTLDCDSHVKPHALSFREEEEKIAWDGKFARGSTGFKVGGIANWELDPSLHRCSCGAEMIFVCQIPAGLEFKRYDAAPVQPDTIERSSYNLFLGKSTYIFACKEQCTPHSLYAVSQDKD